MTNLEKFFASPRNFTGLMPPLSDFSTARVVLLPVPFDGTAEWHSGSREAPGEIIDASEYLEFYDMELEREIQEIGIHTLPFIQPDYTSVENTIDRVFQVSREIVNSAKFLFTLGGEHTISLGPVKAYLEKYPDLSVLQLDAHADLRDEYNGARFCQASVMRRIYEMCPVVLAGTRSISLEEKTFIDKKKIPVFYHKPARFNSKDLQEIIGSLSENIYVTIDVDVLDPSIMSAVGTPEPGGIYWEDIIKILKSVGAKKHVVGADIVELCPREGPSSCVFLTAKMAYKMMGYFVH